MTVLADRGRRRGRSRSRTAASTPSCRSSARCSRRTTIRRRPSWRASAAPAARSASPPGRPNGFIGELLKIVASHVPPPPGVASPILWGTEPYLRELFGDAIDSLDVHGAHLHLPLPLGRGVRRPLPHLLRPDPEGVRGRRRGGGKDALFADLVDLVRRYAGTGYRSCRDPGDVARDRAQSGADRHPDHPTSTKSQTEGALSDERKETTEVPNRPRVDARAGHRPDVGTGR